jgi:hypothetical protein
MIKTGLTDWYALQYVHELHENRGKAFKSLPGLCIHLLYGLSRSSRNSPKTLQNKFGLKYLHHSARYRKIFNLPSHYVCVYRWARFYPLIKFIFIYVYIYLFIVSIVEVRVAAHKGCDSIICT